MNNNVIILNGRGTKVLKTEYKQRAYDGKWEKIVKIPDFENKYFFLDKEGNKTTVVPMKWLTVGVLDYNMEITV